MLKLLFLDRGGIGDILLRIPFYEAISSLHSIAILTEEKEARIIRFFLKDITIFVYDANKYLWNPFYRRKIDNLVRNAGYAENLVISLPYFHRKILQIAHTLPVSRKFCYLHDVTYSESLLNEFYIIPQAKPEETHYSLYLRDIFGYFSSQINEINVYSFFQDFREKYNKNKTINLSQKKKKLTVIFQPDAGIKGRQYPLIKYQKILEMFSKNTLIKVIGEIFPSLLLENTDTSLVKKSIEETFQGILEADLILGNETGFTHLAYLCGVPTVMVVGGGDFGRFVPWSGFYAENNTFPLIPISHSMECFCCKWDCLYVNVKKENPPCIEKIAFQEVINAVKLLKKGVFCNED